jgi:hypothetical protein
MLYKTWFKSQAGKPMIRSIRSEELECSSNHFPSANVLSSPCTVFSIVFSLILWRSSRMLTVTGCRVILGPDDGEPSGSVGTETWVSQLTLLLPSGLSDGLFLGWYSTWNLLSWWLSQAANTCAKDCHGDWQKEREPVLMGFHVIMAVAQFQEKGLTQLARGTPQYVYVRSGIHRGQRN